MKNEGVMREVKVGMGIVGMGFSDEEREGRLPDLPYADGLVLYVITG